jgi:hypothetical protein
MSLRNEREWRDHVSALAKGLQPREHDPENRRHDFAQLVQALWEQYNDGYGE